MARPNNAPMGAWFKKMNKDWLIRLLVDEIQKNRKLQEENVLLKWCLDKLMFDTDVINVKIHWELWDYTYVRSDKQLKLNVKD